MALSVKQQKALEQLMMPLYILYGSNYFNEEEWIKIDALIHKGKYVFTNGPPTNPLEEPLMTFEDAKPHKNTSIGSTEPTQKDPKTTKPDLRGTTGAYVPREQTSCTSSMANSLLETPNDTSGSSDEDTPPSPISDEPKPVFDFSDDRAPIAGKQASQPKPILPLGYTQEQLDESKEFNAGLKKHGYSRAVEDDLSSHWTEESKTTRPYPSPAATEKEARINSWASEVNGSEQQTQQSLAELTSPTCATSMAALVEKFKQLHHREPRYANDFQQPNNPGYCGPKRPKQADSGAASVKAAQSVKSSSQTSHKVTPSVARRNTPAPTHGPGILPGTTYIAQCRFQKSSKMNIDVFPGDHIRVLKHVSAQWWHGNNLTTKQSGQFNDLILRTTPGQTPLVATKPEDAAPSASAFVSTPSPTQAKSEFKSPPTQPKAMSSSSTVSTPIAPVETKPEWKSPPCEDFEALGAASWELDDELAPTSTPSPLSVQPVPVPAPLEPAAAPVTPLHEAPPPQEVDDANAGEWDEVPVRSRNTAPSQALTRPTAARPVIGNGLSSSMFAVLADTLDEAEQSEDTLVLHSQFDREDILKEFKKIVDSKMDEIKRGIASVPTPPTPLRGSTWKLPKKGFNEPLPETIPKTYVCWYWKTGKGCRYTGEECVNLHEDRAGATLLLRDGKASWGAAADYLPSPPAIVLREGMMTCYYWAQEGKCNNSAERCKFAHYRSDKGVAPKPSLYRNWTMDSWVKGDVGEEGEQEGEEAEGKPVLPEAVGTWGDDKYKPPHIKALEIKAQQQAIGW